ncbi:MAG: T9SS type A sorting domain-containing protein, partial [Fibrobacter sp.]|nr:T9SS type A sorting domain-containing protein [Fibrobacter sp.]
SRTTPGKFGASFSRLKGFIDGGHHDAKLTEEEYKRVALWLDLNSMELGAEYNIYDQYAGKLVWPRLDLDVNNPQGIEVDRPLFGTSDVNANIYKKESVQIRRLGSVISVINTENVINKASVYDLSGRNILNLNFSKAVNSFSINTSKIQMAKGTYILKCISGGKNNIRNQALFVVY